MTVASKEESSQFAQIANSLKKRLERDLKQDGSSFMVPILGASGERVRITKTHFTEQKNSKKGKKEIKSSDSGLGLAFKDVVLYDTSKERSVAIYLGEGIDSISQKSEHWFFSQSASGGVGAIFFGDLKNKSQMSSPQYKIRKTQL